MKRGLVLVEGQTEEGFVTECLGPYLFDRNFALIPTIVNTKRVDGGPSFKGGVDNFVKVHNDLKRLFHDTNAAVITGMADRPPGQARRRCEHVEAAWSKHVDESRFLPHIVLHELEAWVYAGPDQLAPWMFDDDPTVVTTIAQTSTAHATPEDINEGPQTAPSKRLKIAYPPYQKTLHGPLALAAIGIDRIRATCPHFDQWLLRLEDFANR